MPEETASNVSMDHWYLSDRKNFHSSPAMRTVAAETFEMAGSSIEEMDFFDLYSCFPSAVQIACDEMKIPLDDARGLTVTGGLPYFGGPGNNYVTHSIAEMVSRLRARPGSFGLVTAVGNSLEDDFRQVNDETLNVATAGFRAGYSQVPEIGSRNLT